MTPEDLPTSVRYVKNGAKGRWWKAAKDEGQIHAGWANVPPQLLSAADLTAIEALDTSGFGETASKATRDKNALRALLDRPSQHLWITFQSGFMWWCTVRDVISANPAGESKDRGNFWLTCSQPWTNMSLGGRLLAVARLPGDVTSTAGFQGTVCEPGAWRAILRIIRDEEDPAIIAATAARDAYVIAIERVIAHLHPKDFELLADLILSRTGWVRVAELGDVIEGIDVEVENASTGEVAFVQVKSSAGQSVLDSYVARFCDRRARYARMIFVVHTTPKDLVRPENLPVQVWDRPWVARLVVQLGLADWVMRRIA